MKFVCLGRGDNFIEFKLDLNEGFKIYFNFLKNCFDVMFVFLIDDDIVSNLVGSLDVDSLNLKKLR